MMINKFGEIVLDQEDLCDLVMQGRDVTKLSRAVIHPDMDLDRLVHFVENPDQLLTWTFADDSDISIPEFDAKRQSTWFMPEQYKNVDIAKIVLDLCTTPEQLQRVGQELLLFQENGLFDLLKYLRYLVHVMKTNAVIWGVGRGSSVASYVLYLLEVHRVDSMMYDLDVREFLR